MLFIVNSESVTLVVSEILAVQKVYSAGAQMSELELSKFFSTSIILKRLMLQTCRLHRITKRYTPVSHVDEKFHGLSVLELLTDEARKCSILAIL